MRMKDIFLYAHGGSGNHGCEAIVRSTLAMLEDISCKKTLISSNVSEDQYYGIDQFCNLLQDIQPFSKGSWNFVKAYLDLKLQNNYIAMDKLQYNKAFQHIKSGDIALSIGGDNYCYADVKKYIMLHDMLLEKGAKTVLWGCSVEPELVERPEIAEDLSRYSLITARETISYNALKKVNDNTVLVSDPAFTLESIVPELPENFQKKNMVGINVSPMVIEREKVSGVIMKCYEKLIEYILEETNMGVVLIPHVVWNGMDDREPLQELYNKFEYTNRIVMVEDHNCLELKGIISQCRFFVGARTHATIAAYSMDVPTLVVGYSVKARGIAKDLFGTEENYVISVQELSREDALKNAFQYIQNREDEIKEHLYNVMPAYKEKAYMGMKKI